MRKKAGFNQALNVIKMDGFGRPFS